MTSPAGYVTEAFTNPPNYNFPHDRLETLRDASKTPVVLVACGSFSPVTYLHLRMFEMAKDYIRHNTEFEVVGIYLSPVSDMYKKPGLLNAHHRVNMCNLAAQDSGGSLMIDPWEAFQAYQRTAIVLDHFDYEINTVLGGISTQDGEHRKVRVMLLAGSDLISTMSEPGVWSYSDLEHILGRYGVFIIERAGSGMDQATDNLAKWRHNIYMISQLIQNDVSSTKVRLFLRRGLSVRYLLPNSVVDYIEENGLYQDESAANANASLSEKGKEKEASSSTAPLKKEPAALSTSRESPTCRKC
ncbi:Nucleotidylyl transferase [Coprinopsis marcescibilis]|uniref:Nicotinamide-nucleotide adenylyltransferase n=1 Tax=Coprinopsis marcescibilis TaxID=230819 RepID=A0A5C3KSH2_COPMA|nr:Nucleotidylyl transferase [Coprinopsis marcescibilis]